MMNRKTKTLHTFLAVVLGLAFFLGGTTSTARAQISGGNPPVTPNVTVVQLPNYTEIRPGRKVTYQVVVSANNGQNIGNVRVNVRFNPAYLAINRLSFSNPYAYLSDIDDGLLQFNSGPVSPGTPLIAWVRFRVDSGAPAGAQIGSRSDYVWFEGSTRYEGTTNLPTLTVAGADTYDPSFDLAIEPVMTAVSHTHIVTHTMPVTTTTVLTTTSVVTEAVPFTTTSIVTDTEPVVTTSTITDTRPVTQTQVVTSTMPVVVDTVIITDTIPVTTTMVVTHTVPLTSTNVVTEIVPIVEETVITETIDIVETMVVTETIPIVANQVFTTTSVMTDTSIVTSTVTITGTDIITTTLYTSETVTVVNTVTTTSTNTVTDIVPLLNNYHVTSDPVYAPGEVLTISYVDAANNTVALGQVSADNDGVLRVDFDASALAPGTYTLHADGAWTGYLSTGAFDVFAPEQMTTAFVLPESSAALKIVQLSEESGKLPKKQKKVKLPELSDQ